MLNKCLLYFITDSTNLDEKDFLNIVEKACIGGVDIIQLREKTSTTREYISLGIKVKSICDKYNIPLIIDDRVDVCLAVNASGVHLGNDDMDVLTARKILGPDKIIGETSKTVEKAILSEKSGADYLGVGAIYKTTTKVKTIITEVSTLKEIINNVNIPVFAIGGLNISNIDILKGSNITGICAISAIMKSKDTINYVKEFKNKIIEIKK